MQSHSTYHVAQLRKELMFLVSKAQRSVEAGRKPRAGDLTRIQEIKEEIKSYEQE